MKASGYHVSRKKIIAMLMVVTMCLSVMGNVKISQATEVNDEYNILDMDNCSVSPKNAQPGDVVTWKFKMVEDIGATNIILELRSPSGEKFYAYNGEVEADSEGFYVVNYTVPEVGLNGEYQISFMEFYNDNTCEAHGFHGTELEDEQWQNLSALSVQISGQIVDETAPTVSKETGEIYIEDGWIYFDFPIVEEGSGVSSRYLTIVSYEESSSSWKYYSKEEFSGRYICDLSVDDFEEGVTYGLMRLEAKDIAGNVGACDFFEEDKAGIDYIPEQYRFTVKHSESDTLMDVLLIDECSVSPKNANAGDVVTWKIKMKEGWSMTDLNVVYPNGHWKSLRNITTTEDGSYSVSFVVPEAGYNGTYAVPSIGVRDAEGSLDTIRSLENSYEGMFSMDLSGLNVTVSGLEEDTEAFTMDVSEIEILVRGDIIRVTMPYIEDLEYAFFRWCYYDGSNDIWNPLETGLGFEKEDLIQTDKGYVGEKNLSEVQNSMYVIYDFDIDKQQFGIAEISGCDIAGNDTDVDVIPCYIGDDFSWAEPEKRTGFDVIPENLRVLLKENMSADPDEEEETKKQDCATGHTYEEWKTVTEATCVNEGSKEHICTVCGHTETQAIPATGEHTYGDWTITKEAQCDKTGSKVKICTVCGDEVEEVILATGFVKGGEFAKGNANYEIKTKKGKKGTVVYQGSTKKNKKVKVPKTVKIKGTTYTVTEIAEDAFKGNTKMTSVTIPEGVTKIGKNAFNGCKNLKTITIESTKLKTVGKDAIKGINKKATIKVPKKQLSKYKKLFKSKTGYKKSMKIKKC